MAAIPLFWSGFEKNSAVNGVEWDSQVGSASTVSTPVYEGTYAGRLVDGGGAGTRWEKTITSANSNGPWYIDMRIRVAVFGTGASYASGNRFISANPDSGISGMQIRLNTNGTLELWDSTVQIGSDSSALSVDTWYLIKIYLFNNTGSGKLELSASINDTIFASTTTSANTSAFRFLRLGEMMGTAGTPTDIYYDKIRIMDASPDEMFLNRLRPNVWVPGLAR